VATADLPQPNRRAEPLALTIAGLLVVGAAAQFLRFYPLVISAALAVAFSWAATRAPLRDLGLRWPERPLRLLGGALLLAIGMNAFGRTFLWPTLYRTFGERDLRYLGPIEGNLDVVLQLMPLIWLSAAICEEIVYRGFLQQRLERLFGGTFIGNAVAVVLTSAVFAANHAVQGTSGMIQTFIVSCVLGAIFIRSRHNLLLMILIHGVWDTFSVTVMYFGLRW
jgi:membrane protease YdiL (CAAX protease family)